MFVALLKQSRDGSALQGSQAVKTFEELKLWNDMIFVDVPQERFNWPQERFN
jgi:hypothetical protein